MFTRKCLIVLLIIMESVLLSVDSKRTNRHLSRKKRYLSFPEGAAFSAVWCLTSQMRITDGASIFSEGINWGLVYELPNDTKPLLDPYSAVQKRRNRRALYAKAEDILTSVGYNGRACILRSLCEASRHFRHKEDSLVHQILSIIFKFPQDPLLSHEPGDHRIYHWASQIGSRSITDYDRPMTEECSDVFQCPFSLIDMALGYYSHMGPVDSDYVY